VLYSCQVFLPVKRPSYSSFLVFFFSVFPARLKIKCDKQIPCQSCQVCATQCGASPGRILSDHTHHIAERVCLFVSERSVFCSLFFGPMSTMLKAVLLIIRQPCHRTGDPVRIILTTLPLPTMQSMGLQKLTGGRSFFPIASSLPLRNTCTVGLPA